MHRLRFALLVAVCLRATPAGEAIPKQEHRQRRAELRKSIRDGVLVLFGRTEQEMEDANARFRQEPNFLYLSGWEEPGAVLALAPSGEFLFLPPHDAKAERYTGRKTAAEDRDASAVTGFERVLPRSALEAHLRTLLASHPKLYGLEPQPARLGELAPGRPLHDARPAITRLRLRKSPREIQLIRKAVEVSVEAHRAVWKRIAPGLGEHQVAATLTGSVLESGCEGTAYTPIVASGLNALVLHYARNSRRLESGELVLIDSGAECSSYTADITRTVPVSGQFTPRQRELYQVVLGAQQAVLRAVRPGVTLGANNTAPNSLYKIAYDYIDSHGRDRQGKPLGQYVLHGVSHHVGLEVHDPGAAGDPLEPGMVITVEPGIYIPEEGIGIRIEDMVAVTERGAQVLSGGLAKDPGEIEKAMRSLRGVEASGADDRFSPSATTR